MSVGRVFSRAFAASRLACSHCGSAELYPSPGLFGELGGFLGRVRYACRVCRRHTWLSRDALVPRAEPDELELEPPPSPGSIASLDDLDIGASLLPPPGTDLRALDEELAHGRGMRKGRWIAPAPGGSRTPAGPRVARGRRVGNGVAGEKTRES